MLTNYSRSWELPSGIVNITSKIPLEKMNLSFANRYQLQIASWLGVGVHVYSPSPVSTGTPSSWNACRPWTSYHHLWVYMCLGPGVSGRHCFLWVIHYFWLLKPFRLLLHIDPWALKGRLGWRPLGLTAPKSLLLRMLSSVGLCVSSHLRQKLLWWVLSKPLLQQSAIRSCFTAGFS